MENTDFSGSETVDVWMVQVRGLVSVYDQAQWCLLLGECMSSILLRGSDVPASLGPSPLSMAAPNLYLGSLGDLCACTFFFFGVVKKYSLKGQRGKGAELCLPRKFVVAITQIKRIRQCMEFLRLCEAKNNYIFSSYLSLRCQHVLSDFFLWILDAVPFEKKIKNYI